MGDKRGLYIHIPFCVKKCNYCAFLSFAAEPEVKREYIRSLVSEIALRAGLTKEPKDRICLDSIYLGGGTPSVLEISDTEDIMRTIKSSFKLKPNAEITIEVNPGTLGEREDEIRAKLSAYRNMGFNRISMGVQSMDNDRLKFLGRIHTAEDVARDVRIAREAGLDNINLDLMFSLPGESTEDALEDAKKIIALRPEHISCYSLQIEENTLFADQIESGEISEVSDEEDRDTYHRLCALLKGAGYEHYEISNFARFPKSAYAAPGFGMACHDRDRSQFRSRHNSLYWDMSDYIACGLGASGFENNRRYKNVSDINEYACRTRDNCHTDTSLQIAEEGSYLNTAFDNASEAVFTGLRRREGITYEEVCRAYMRAGGEKKPFWEIFAPAKKEALKLDRSGHLIIDEEGLRLTEKGIDISNSIMALFV